jgi:hypothetical protein
MKKIMSIALFCATIFGFVVLTSNTASAQTYSPEKFYVVSDSTKPNGKETVDGQYAFSAGDKADTVFVKIAKASHPVASVARTYEKAGEKSTAGKKGLKPTVLSEALIKEGNVTAIELQLNRIILYHASGETLDEDVIKGDVLTFLMESPLKCRTKEGEACH